jgi:hypothetical protein
MRKFKKDSISIIRSAIIVISSFKPLKTYQRSRLVEYRYYNTLVKNIKFYKMDEIQTSLLLKKLIQLYSYSKYFVKPRKIGLTVIFSNQVKTK